MWFNRDYFGHELQTRANNGTNISIFTAGAPAFFITTNGPLNKAGNIILGEGLDDLTGKWIDKLLSVHR